MDKIHKVILDQPVGVIKDLKLSILCRILKIDVQHGKLRMWYVDNENLYDENGEPKDGHLIIKIRMTGESYPCEEEYEYIDTFMLDHGNYVGHVFAKSY